ncbi:sodium-dependent transporter [Helicobacter cappadocius]|uniref:Transporter n=1 Tax=Helicobacter cappadocius TaxID=3063998 RepID=A0AA90PV03_9HELI|nr:MULTISPECIES: sodium-dependent transporter [unclassified Helicobacter]MDO7253006.1 sodium-dependent transporter [Helicobacter sp. faydin-H75]MDP2539005.1 sodium-dependent transporter [Helicobacter sp. faydin-H76]
MGNFSKLGFILATLGSSIGLGHIWRFPYMAGVSGGGGFVLLFLFLSLSIGISMLVGEMLIGYTTNKNTTEAFKELDPSPKKRWGYAGITLIGGPFILTFYSIVLGWVAYYLFVVSFNLPTDVGASEAEFNYLLTQSILPQILGFTAVLGITGWVVSKGIKNGIEKLNFVLMPLLFIIFIGLLIYAMTMPSFSKAFDFMFAFKLKDITPNVLVASLGQVFFSLSLGVGIIITYSASASEKQNLLKSAFWVVIPGILISLIAGLMIFTFVFEYGAKVSEGAGLVFVSLPLIFGQMGIVGNVISVLFLVALGFAGITSTISLLEPSVKYIIDRFALSRFVATWIIALAIYIVGIVMIFSLNVDYKNDLTFFGKSLFDWADFSSSAIVMPLGGFLSVIFVGWIVGKQRVYEFSKHFLSKKMFEVWFFILRYIAPLVVIVIWVAKFIELFS